MKNGIRIALVLIFCLVALVLWLGHDRSRSNRGSQSRPQQESSARVASGASPVAESNDPNRSPLPPEALPSLKRNRVEGVADSIYSQVEVYGQVFFASKPTTRLAGVLLEFKSANRRGAEARRTRTDSQGFYSVLLSAPAVHQFSFSMEANVDDEEPRLIPLDFWLNIDGVQKRKRKDLALPAWGHLRLRVRAPNGRPAPAAPLLIHRKGIILAATRSEVSTNAAGLWEGSLLAGTYTVISRSQDSGLGRVEVTVAANSDQEEVLQLSRPERIVRGRVLDAKSGLGIARARLQVLGAGQSHPTPGVVSSSYTTDDRGEFVALIDLSDSQEDLPARLRQAGGRQQEPGNQSSFYLRASADGYLRTDSAVIEPPDGPFDLRGIEIPMTPGQTVSGMVVDRNGKPVAGAEVSIRRQETNGSMSSSTIRSDKEGHFSFEGLGPVECRLKASHSLGMSEELSVQPPAELVMLKLRHSARVGGTVIWPNGKPVTDPFSLLLIRDVESFSIDNLTFYPHLFQDSQGKFELSGMLPGRYTLEAWVQVLDENTGDMTRLDGKSDPFEMKESGTPKVIVKMNSDRVLDR